MIQLDVKRYKFDFDIIWDGDRGHRARIKLSPINLNEFLQLETKISKFAQGTSSPRRIAIKISKVQPNNTLMSELDNFVTAKVIPITFGTATESILNCEFGKFNQHPVGRNEIN